jgi:hypothetical protein
MARFADLIGPVTPPESGSTAAVAPPPSAPEPMGAIAAHDEVGAALSDLGLGNVVSASEPSTTHGDAAPDPTAALAAAFRTVVPDDTTPNAEAQPQLAPMFDDDLLPTRVVKGRRR